MTTSLAHGRDISCTDTLQTGRFATGARLVAQAAYRRLITPRGMLRGGEAEANYGLDLADLIGSSSTKADAAALPGKIRAELSKDERIDTASIVVDVVRTVDGPSVAYEISIAADTIDGEPFELVVGVADVTVSLLGLDG